MAFKVVASLDCDTTITLGGVDKKTKKKNPTQIEGYFLGSKETGPNKFNKAKTDLVHIFQTPKGNVGVWGKTDLDRKIKNVVPGTMVRATFDGTLPTNKGNDMLKYKVEVDESETIDVGDLIETSDNGGNDNNTQYGDDPAIDDEDYDNENEDSAETLVANSSNSVTAAERTARVQALLSKSKTKN